MPVQRHDGPHPPPIERTFIAVRAALPAANVAAFDTELEAITRAPVVDLAALDDFLSGWWRIATRAVADRPTGSGCTKRPSSFSPVMAARHGSTTGAVLAAAEAMTAARRDDTVIVRGRLW